ncbi:hypothetical protein BDV34DRAFT_201120 [Aspergillus parasiticus]|uniref:Uncharacterized protein n=1 Tax=Aspergillus parasiticus TaxID=5067 RepID=A0A5N6DDZ6_ASPPA|nr:hypothetical protein BDV34DRAFT_201120 [Aspergillus parasiticus]
MVDCLTKSLAKLETEMDTLHQHMITDKRNCKGLILKIDKLLFPSRGTNGRDELDRRHGKPGFIHVVNPGVPLHIY